MLKRALDRMPDEAVLALTMMESDLGTLHLESKTTVKTITFKHSNKIKASTWKYEVKTLDIKVDPISIPEQKYM